MKLHALHIERDEGDACCGTLAYSLGDAQGTLLWTIELSPRREIQVEVFPTQSEDAHRIAMAEGLIIDRLLDALIARRSLVA